MNFEQARGNNFADFFLGGAGFNLFEGRGGVDTYEGGNNVKFENNRLLAFQEAWNWVDYRNDGGTQGINVTLTNSSSYIDRIDANGTGGTGTDTFGNVGEVFVNINAIRGSMVTATGDVVTGNDYFNYFEGLSGNDTFNGGGGQDRYGYQNEATNGGVGGVIVNLSSAAITVGATTVQANTARDSFGFTDTFGTRVAAGVTITDVEEIQGTNSADTFVGGAANNTFFGRSGNDVFILGDGFDYVETDGGNDTVYGGAATAGFDQSYEDRDTLSFDNYGANGIDHIYIDLNSGTVTDPTGGGIDTIYDIERVRGTLAGDTIIGSDFSNQREETFYGLAGNDTIDGRGGYNIADYTRDKEYRNGAAVVGDQAIIANLSNASITVGANTVAAGTIRDGWGDIDTVSYIQSVRGTVFNDTFQGNDDRNIFRVMDGVDTVNGGGGNDAVEMYQGDFFINDGVGGTGAIVDLVAGTARAAHEGVILGQTSILNSIEDVAGSYLSDTISGNGLSNALGGSFRQ